jgi:hypothetical protein
MRYRAEAYHINSKDLAKDLLHWETWQAALEACERHAGVPLSWQLPWTGL